MLSHLLRLTQRRPSIALLPHDDIEIIASETDPFGVTLWRVSNGPFGRRLHPEGTFDSLSAARRYADFTGLPGDWIADLGGGQKATWYIPFPTAARDLSPAGVA